MPRTRKLSQAIASPSATKVSIARHTINLRSIPRNDPANTTAAQLRDLMFAKRPPEQDLWRTRYGRALNLDVIENALRNADWGGMRLLTDLSRETIDTDPHLASVLNKRFGAISALPWEIIPIDGLGVDKAKATFYSDVVRSQIKQLPNFGQRVLQLAWGLFDGRASLENEWALTPMIPNLPTPVHQQYGTVNWMIRDLGWIHPRRLHYGPERELRVYDDLVSGSFAEYGIALRDTPLKFIYWTPQLFGDYPEREGLARRCLYWSFFKRFSARERMILLELFGKPFRWLEVDEDSTADKDDLISADDQLQNIGGNSSFRFPRGTRFKVEQPGPNAGQVHQETIEESDKQLSKLVLGQTGTTDANPAGLNNVQANVMQDEQFMILMRDAAQISEVIETFLTDAIIELNFGPQELSYAPHFRLRADVPLDRTKELARLKAAVDAGLEVPLSEAYEISGFRQPKEDEPIIKLETPPLHPLAVQPPPERPVIVWPENAALPARKTQPIAPSGEGGLESPEGLPPAQAGGGLSKPAGELVTPTDALGESILSDGTETPATPQEKAEKKASTVKPESIISVNEARKENGYGPLLRPDGSPDPDGNLVVTVYEAKMKAAVATEAKIAEAVLAPTPAPVTATPEDNAEPTEENDNESGDSDVPSGGTTPAPEGTPSAAPSAPPTQATASGPINGSLRAEQLSNQVRTATKVILPFAGFKDFDDCMTKVKEEGHSEESAGNICGALYKEYHGSMRGLERAHPADVRLVQTIVLTDYLASSAPKCSSVVHLANDLPKEVRSAAQPEEKVIGSIETLIGKGAKEGARELQSVAAEYAAGIKGLTTAAEISKALDRIHDDVDLHGFLRSIERRTLHGAMAGAIANQYEFETDTVLPVAEFERNYGPRIFLAPTGGAPADPQFVSRGLNDAIRWFRQRAVVTRDVFDRLEAAAKRRAFTIAQMTNNQMLQRAKDELEAHIREGKQLRDFKKAMELRFISSGFTPANPSHVETIYRTNVLNAYNAGRHAQATQPAVLRVRPYWQIRTVNDGPPRQRETHQAVHLWVLKADDSIWQTIYPPFGFNCRCRTTTLSEKEVKARSLRIRTGGEIHGLPDPGFTSGVASLL